MKLHCLFLCFTLLLFLGSHPPPSYAKGDNIETRTAFDPSSEEWNWKDSVITALKENNALGNIMINRVGRLWWDRSVPANAKEYNIRINGYAFHVCTFGDGPAFFQTMGWYGWENWGFDGNFTRQDKFTVTFN